MVAVHGGEYVPGRATNILVTQSDGVTVTGNAAGISNVAIFIDGNQATVSGNETFLSLVFDGIRLTGNQGLVRANQVFNGSESGIFVGGDNNVVERNTITEAAIGILKMTGATGNLILNNRVFGAPITVQDPSEAKLAGIISPLR